MKLHSTLTLFALLLPLHAAGAQDWCFEEEPPYAEDVREATQVAVLGYGRIGEGGLSLPDFVRQLHYLRGSGLTPISLSELLAWRRGEIELPARCVLITFDEAGQELADAAIPLMQHHGFPFLLFVDAHNLRGDAGYLSPRQLQQLASGGVALGSHTMTRPSREDWQFGGLSGAQASSRMVAGEMERPAATIRALVGRCDAFSYPEGYADPLMLTHMADCGYRAAFSQREGKLAADAPAYMLHRYMVESPADFARAVNFGGETELPHVVAELARQPSTLPGELQGLVEGSFADDEEAEDAPAANAELIPCVHNPALARREEGGDWVTPTFAAPLVPREQTRVAVLGYHNFSNSKRVTDMLMRTSEFCTQMQYIRDAGLSVISMQDFLEWKRGERLLPERCVLITIDDGWKSVYTDAYPVLRAYGYPFTLFLYTRYINVQGDSLTYARIREMMEHGATIGSHSCNHLYPRSWRKLANDEAAYAAQVAREIGESRAKLQQLFGKCSTYCYPGGYNTPLMLEGLTTAGYEAAFTVLEAKVDCNEPDQLVHRYMVLGTEPRVFRRAVNFDGEAGVAPVRAGVESAEARAREFFPAAFELPKPANTRRGR